jgi:hypothetical protein
MSSVADIPKKNCTVNGRMFNPAPRAPQRAAPTYGYVSYYEKELEHVRVFT